MKKLIEASKPVILSLATALFVLVLIMAFAQLANASGGKEKNPWQPIQDDETSSVFLPVGLDTDNCQEIAVTQAGKTYLCQGDTIGDFTVFVPE